MGKLELKQRKFLFHALEFITMVGPTTVMIQLIMQYKKPFLMLPHKRIDQILLSVIRGSKYSIATSLKMAALAGEFASIDLSAKEAFLKLKEKYEGIAVELIKQIESHHLAAVLLETPSDIEGMTPLELAFEYRLFAFLSQSKIEKIAHQVWYEQFFLNPKRTFEVSDVDAWNVLELMRNPYKFYFKPFGKYVIATFLFTAYLFMFSYILFERPSIFDPPEVIEVIFWVFNIGYLGFECYQALIEDGIKDYLSDWTNYIDMAISINFATQIVLRVIWIFDPDDNGCDNNKLSAIEWNYNTGLAMNEYQKCPTTSQIRSTSGYWSASCGATFADWPRLSNDTNFLCDFDPSQAFYYPAEDKCDCWKQLDYYLSNSCCREDDSSSAVAFNFLYGFNAILLWMRVLYFAEQNSTLGPLIKIVLAMKDDFANYLKLTLLFMIGFSFAIRAFIGDYSREFSTVPSTILYMFKSTFGKIDFSVLEACGEADDDLCSDSGWISTWRSNLVQTLIMGYLIIALIMIRLLIAMISFTYNKIIRQAEHQVVYQYIKNAYELDRSSGLMPPPLNIFVFAVAIVWLIMDLLMVILINRYIDVENHLQLAKPVGSSYIKRVWHGIQDLFARNNSYWICAHCKEHNYERYDVNRYLSQFRPSCDPADTKIVEVYSPEICQRCYRNKTAVGRMTIVLQQISFGIFTVVVYPVLFTFMLIPAIISWIADFLTDDSGDEGQWGDQDDEDDKKNELKRHQTMNGATLASTGRARSDSYKQSAEYKIRKKREKEAKKQKEKMKRAEQYRMLRQMQQLDTQLNALPTSDSHTTVQNLKKSLKSIIRGYRQRGVHILTPNINEIVDEVTSDKTPIAKLQLQVTEIKTLLNELAEIVRASNQFTVASALVNMQSMDPEDRDDHVDDKKDGGGDKGGDDDGDIGPLSLSALTARKSKSRQASRLSLKNRDSTMAFVSAAAEQLQTALSMRSSSINHDALLPSTNTKRGLSDKFEDIAASLLMPADDKDKNSITYKPTDVMRHKSSYKKKSRREIPISSNITDKDYNFNTDDEIVLTQADLHEEADDNNDNNDNEKKPDIYNQMSDNTENMLNHILDEEDIDTTDNEKP